MNNKNVVGVLDSGLGGLSVLNKLLKLNINSNYIYFADSKNAPYGVKSKKDIQKLSIDIINNILNYNKNINNIIIACNTITTKSIDILKQNFPNINFFGTYPSLESIFTTGFIFNEKKLNLCYNNKKQKNKITIDTSIKRKKILILSTTATSKSDYLKNQIKLYNKFCDIFVKPADKIVKFVEANEINSPKCYAYLKRVLNKYHDIDYLLLGCTHFPFVKNIIKEILGNNLTIIDNTDITTNNFYKYYLSNCKNNNSSNKNTIKIIDTKFDKNREIIYKKLLELNSNNLKFIYEI